MSDAPAGITWGDLVGALVAQHGTLTAVAWRLIEHGDDVASIERALRRLRGRGQHDGGVWGQRVLRVFGMPVAIEARLRWVGLYQSPFNDLPLPLCLDQLRLWDRPPISESRARVWLHLGHASCAARGRQLDEAARHAERATAALAGMSADREAPWATSARPNDERAPEAPGARSARIELALLEGYLASRRHDPAAVEDCLGRADRLLAGAALEPGDRACFRARLVDQRAYQLNHRDDHVAAGALYDALPDADEHPFASYRRDAGRAYGRHRAGQIDEAVRLVHAAIDHAGDGGYTRLRAMGLLMLARFLGPSGDGARARARAIAVRLDDGELLARVERNAAR